MNSGNFPSTFFQNIMVNQDGDLFLVDWGLAKVYVRKDGKPQRLGADADDHRCYGTIEFGKCFASEHFFLSS
jgi:hypothetical protein